MKKMLVLAGVALALLTGCMSVNTNDGAVAPNVKVVPKKYITDIDVQKTTASGEATVNCLFNFITWGVSEYADEAFVKTGPLVTIANANDVAKQGATYNACEKAKADYILGAKYRIDTEDYFVYKKIKCVVTGYPGTIKGVKEVTCPVTK